MEEPFPAVEKGLETEDLDVVEDTGRAEDAAAPLPAGAEEDEEEEEVVFLAPPKNEEEVLLFLP